MTVHEKINIRSMYQSKEQRQYLYTKYNKLLLSEITYARLYRKVY